MPLMKSKSKKAFSKNVETEMHAGKPQDQALAIAYSVKRKAKKMAKGGEASAASEKRPMPDDRHDDAKMVSQNDHKRDNGQDGWTDNPTKEQAVMNNGRAVKKIKHPSMTQSPVFKVRLRDEEDDLEMSAKPASPDEQPEQERNEVRPNRKGPSVPSLKMKRMAKGGMINEKVSFDEAEEDMDPDMSPIRESYDHPSEEEYMAGHFAKGGDVEDPDAKEDQELGADVEHLVMDHFKENKEAEEKEGDSLYANGGKVDADEEMAIDHAASIAAAIMAKRRMMAKGGEVDLSINADEEPNHEDQMSFEALKKENYSESDALNDVDQPEDSNEHSPEHDEEDINDRSIVGAIRRKMKSKSPISR